MTFSKSYFVKLLLLGASIPSLVHAAPFGAPDPRAAAMGKTGVASAANSNAGYFNPALLATFSERKHMGRNQRIAFPAASAFVSNNSQDLIDIEDADYELLLADAVIDFNNNQNIDGFIQTLQSLDTDLNNVSSEPLFADTQINMVFRVPDRDEGGAFYFSRRAIIDGNLTYNAADAALIADYLEELEFVNAGGTPETLHPELYDNGDLVDPNDGFVSSADAAGLVIEEMAMSMAWAVTWWGSDMMVGVTPKVMRVTTYEYTAAATSGNLTEQGEFNNKENFNLDLGWAKHIDDQLTVGLTVKNLLPQDYQTESGNTVSLKPQVRIGSAYETAWGNFAIDLDLLENEPLSNGDPIQELGIGGEWTVWNQSIRAGVVTNLAATSDNAAPLYTFGFHLQLGAFYSDFTYGQGDDQQSAALQFGLQF